jgi:hypothetical protein
VVPFPRDFDGVPAPSVGIKILCPMEDEPATLDDDLCFTDPPGVTRMILKRYPNAHRVKVEVKLTEAMRKVSWLADLYVCFQSLLPLAQQKYEFGIVPWVDKDSEFEPPSWEYILGAIHASLLTTGVSNGLITRGRRDEAEIYGEGPDFVGISFVPYVPILCPLSQ